MIIEILDDTKTRVLSTTWKFKDSEQEYFVTWSACDNPICDCSEIKFGIKLTEDTSPLALICLDIKKNETKILNSESSDKSLAKQLKKELSQKDHDILYGIFISEKEKVLII